MADNELEPLKLAGGLYFCVLSWIHTESGSNERLQPLPGVWKRELRVEEMNNRCEKRRRNKEEPAVSSTSPVSIMIGRSALELDDTAAIRLFFL